MSIVKSYHAMVFHGDTMVPSRPGFGVVMYIREYIRSNGIEMDHLGRKIPITLPLGVSVSVRNINAFAYEVEFECEADMMLLELV